MQLKWLLLVCILSVQSRSSRGDAGCRCDLYLPDGSTLVFSTGHAYPVPCTNLEEASNLCRGYCQAEVRQLNEGFIMYPDMMQDNKPYACASIPQAAVPYYTYCNQPQLIATNEMFDKAVCCDETGTSAQWCDANSETYNKISRSLELNNPAIAENRALDTTKNKDDVENNEIEGSTKKEVNKEIVKDASAEDDSNSWMTYLMKFFGYKSITEMMSKIDIFSIPEQIRRAIVNYGDEIGMGQCYMEFTTYSIFTRQENPFEAFLRNKRDVDDDEAQEPQMGLHDENSVSHEAVFVGRESSERQAQVQTIKSMVEGFADLLKQSETTRQYADIITRLLPTVLKLYTSKDPQQALGSIFTQVIGPMIAQQMTQSPAVPPSNSIDKTDVKPAPSSWPNFGGRPQRPNYQQNIVQPTQAPASSPLASMVMNLFKNYLTSYMAGPQQQPQQVALPVHRPQPVRQPVQQASSGGLGNLIGLLLGNNNVAQRPKPAPPVKKVTTKPIIPDKKKENNFADMVLDVVKPVFISIVGKSPGENGVESIREVSRLSTQGRVDDALKEEVLSPLFCAKNYAVNKAWTITERGIRSIIKSFTPQERERMKKMLF